MGDTVKITKNGFIDIKWNGDTQEYEDKIRDTYVSCLRKEVEIEEGVTLKDIFTAVEKDELLKSFISMYSWCRDMDQFLAQIKQPVSEPDTGDKIDYLEVYWDAEVWTYKKHKKEQLDPSVDFYTGFHGWGQVTTEEQKKMYGDTDKIAYSVSCTPMYVLADLPIKVNTDIEIHHIDETSKTYPHSMTLFKGKREFSLLDFLDAIFWDISFYGGPSEAAAFLGKMQKTVEGIKEGTVETFPWEDVKKELCDDED
jgi:hypothetical protein